jgi:hypothetical protein
MQEIISDINDLNIDIIEELTNSVSNEIINELNQLENDKKNPAPQIIIDNLECEKYDIKKHSNCSICLEKYDKKDNICNLKCKHNFHKDCLTKWLTIDNSCPICRKSLSITPIRKSKLIIDSIFITILFPNKSILYKSFNKNLSIKIFLEILNNYYKCDYKKHFIRNKINKNTHLLNNILDKTIIEYGLMNGTKIHIY